MTTTYIASEISTWGGSPRTNQNQYIQDAIDAGSAGDTYILNAGTHRGQDILFQTGDELVIAAGARLSGAEDIDTSGWTASGAEWYKAVTNVGDYQENPHGIATGFDPASVEMMILDGELYPWYSSSYADAGGCRYTTDRVYIGIDPATLSTIEICRKGRIRGPGVLLAGASSAERAEVYGYACADGVQQRAGINLTGTNPVFRDLEVYAFSGFTFGLMAGSYLRNVTAHDCGELAIGVSEVADGMVVGEGCHFYTNGVGGWSNGNEGGNAKFAASQNLHIRGSLWEMGPDTARWNGNDPPSALWFDINNDGYNIYSNVIRDEDHRGWRGLFLEISYSGKVYNNVLVELAWNAEDPFWAWGLIMSSTGAEPPNTIYDDIEIWGNLLYKCNGGIGGVQNRFGFQQTYAKYDPSSCKNWDIHNNTTYWDGTEDQSSVGMSRPTQAIIDDTTIPVENNHWEDNTYLIDVAASSFYNDQIDGSGGSSLSWAQWNSAGQDDVSGQYLVAADYDPDPFNGGAM